jgi:hypothetical protein
VVLVALAGLLASIGAGVAFASNQTWLIKSASGKTATGIFKNTASQKVISVAVKSSDPHKNPVTAFSFAGHVCKLDGQGGAACASVAVATGKSATFRVTTKLAIAKVGFQGCSAVSQPTPGAGGSNPPPPPPSGTGPTHSAPLHCDRAQFPTKAHPAARPKPTAAVKVRIRGFLNAAIANETTAIADLKAHKTTAARGAVIKAVAHLQSVQKLGASYELGYVNRDVAAALGADQNVLSNYTESPTAAQFVRGRVILRSAVASEKAAIKALAAL